MDEKTQLPTAEVFYMNLPLYDEISYSQADIDELGRMLFINQLNDVYCPDCESSSLFRVNEQHSTGYSYHWHEGSNSYYKRVFTCLRNTKHILTFYFRIDDFKVQKVGQHPSMADLNTYDVKKYSTVLDKKQYSDLRKAIGLASHGIGIGSFVYIRRIFEDLVEKARCHAEEQGVIDIEKYKSCRMAEKIKMLEENLPPFLVEHRNIYGILSKGVHELTEEECLNSFEIVKVGIEIILDEHLEEKARKAKIDAASKAIKNIQP
ncbi:short-chain dehydrogenase [Klebsiella michiganensis]|uniref:hypothetical protein n=1 Tax=Klebsiella michiganensis TaxID=1134687 RepID=UPI001CCA1F8E|nr:hypothetical protein [Klebsiella michiganensis]MBZ7346837.1 short-chain dehydrogenase [Klebsiella michiganensis]